MPPVRALSTMRVGTLSLVLGVAPLSLANVATGPRGGGTGRKPRDGSPGIPRGRARWISATLSPWALPRRPRHRRVSA